MIPTTAKIDFEHRSTGGKYGGIYDSKCSAIYAFDECLHGFGFYLDTTDNVDLNGTEGSVNWRIIDSCGKPAGCATFDYCKVDGGWQVFGKIN